MSNVVEGVSRRKLYDYMMIFESFLLELEQFILYKSHSTIEVESNNLNFKEGLLDIFSKCIIVIHFFFDNKIISSSTEFLKEVSKKQEKTVDQIKTLTQYKLFSQTEVDSLLILLTKLQSNWTSNLDDITLIFEKSEEFHTKLIKVLEFQRK